MREPEASRPRRADAGVSACAASLRHLGSLIGGELDRCCQRQGLSSAGFSVLQVLQAAGGSAAPHQISDRLGVSRATVTGLLDGLEQRRLVRRTRDDLDRRMRRIVLTPRARALVVDLTPEHDRAMRRMFAGLPAADRRQLVQLLGRLQSHLGHPSLH